MIAIIRYVNVKRLFSLLVALTWLFIYLFFNNFINKLDVIVSSDQVRMSFSIYNEKKNYSLVWQTINLLPVVSTQLNQNPRRLSIIQVYVTP